MKISEFIASAKRILVISRKPTKDELTTMVKITGIGIALIGVIGYAIDMIFKLTGI